MPAGEDLEPCFGCLGIDVAEAVQERGRAPFEFSKDPLDGVPISVATYLKSEPSSGQRGLEVLSAIDQKYGGFDIVFLAKFSQKNFG